MRHLGHILSHNLSDAPDIIDKTKDLAKKAKYMLHTFSCCDRFTKSTLFMSFVSDCLVLLSGPSLVPSSSLWKWPSIISYVIFGDCLISVTPIFRTSLLLSIVCLILFMIDHWDWLIQPSTPIPSFYMMCSTTAPSWLTVLLATTVFMDGSTSKFILNKIQFLPASCLMSWHTLHSTALHFMMTSFLPAVHNSYFSYL